jgi:hypothetical protein
MSKRVKRYEDYPAGTPNAVIRLELDREESDSEKYVVCFKDAVVTSRVLVSRVRCSNSLTSLDKR